MNDVVRTKAAMLKRADFRSYARKCECARGELHANDDTQAGGGVDQRAFSCVRARAPFVSFFFFCYNHTQLGARDATHFEF